MTLTEAADKLKPSLALATDVLVAAEALGAEYLLRRSLTEPNAAPEQLAHLADTLFGPLVGKPAVGLMRTAVAQSWPSADALAWQVRDEAVRLAWRTLVADGAVDDIRQQMLALAALAETDKLRTSPLCDMSCGLDERQALAAALTKKAPTAVGLFTRAAVGDPRDGFVANLSHQLDVLAQLRGHLRAKVTTPVAMTAAQSTQMDAQLSRIYGNPIDLEPVVDPRLVGGVRVDVGGDVIDGSIKARLDAAREAMSGITVKIEDGADA